MAGAAAALAVAGASLALGLLALTLPARVRVFAGEAAALPLGPGLMPGAAPPQVQVFPSARGGWQVVVARPGAVRLPVRLWGRLPLGGLQVDAVPSLRLVPGGQAIGVLYARDGVVVEELAPVREPQGSWRWPGREAGLSPGDVVLAVDDRPARDPEGFQRALEQAAPSRRRVRLVVRRGESTFQTWLVPVRRCLGAGQQPAAATRHCPHSLTESGVRVREGTAGVGTLSFYDPASRLYGALGHMVTSRGRTVLPLDHGQIVWATITSVSRGSAGRPGEKVGAFARDQRPSGTIERNTPVGIFGRLLEPPPASGPFAAGLAVPVALSHQVHEGPVQLLTVLEGERVEAFQAEIVHIRPPGIPESQRLILRITDPQLLARTGGIVQGMSGSPLLQDGRLVGAVTHVSVQDPTRGFGVLIEPMLEQSGLWGLPGRAAGGSGRVSKFPPVQTTRHPQHATRVAFPSPYRSTGSRAA